MPGRRAACLPCIIFRNRDANRSRPIAGGPLSHGFDTYFGGFAPHWARLTNWTATDVPPHSSNLHAAASTAYDDATLEATA